MDAQILAQAMGNTKAAQFAGPFTQAMRAAGCTTVRRAAMWCAQLGHESVSLVYMEEIADGEAYENRADLGNTHPGDGPRFKGRGPIQITGRHNYEQVSQWAHEHGYVPSPTWFVDHPQDLGTPRYGFLGAVWYWTVARPGINAMCDAGDLEGVTRAINGGLNGLADRRARYNRCLELGERLLEGAVDTRHVDLKVPGDQVGQDTYYNCGPASAQTVIRIATSILVGENDLAHRLGTTVGGTSDISVFPDVLNSYCHGADYRFRHMPHDPPTLQERDRLWRELSASLDNGWPVIANIVAPPSNYPRAIDGPSPNYHGGTVYHYVAITGYDAPSRTVRVTDSGFTPHEYWISFDQLATLIPPKGYAYATGQHVVIGHTDKDWETMEIQSFVNRAKKFSAALALSFIDRATWENRQLLLALCAKNGIDADRVIKDALIRENT